MLAWNWWCSRGSERTVDLDSDVHVGLRRMGYRVSAQFDLRAVGVVVSRGGLWGLRVD